VNKDRAYPSEAPHEHRPIKTEKRFCSTGPCRIKIIWQIHI